MTPAPTQRTLVLAPNLHDADRAGFRQSRRCLIVTPRNIEYALRGVTLDSSYRVIAVNLSEQTAKQVLGHPAVLPAWMRFEVEPTVEHISTHRPSKETESWRTWPTS